MRLYVAIQVETHPERSPGHEILRLRGARRFQGCRRRRIIIRLYT